MTTCSRIGWAPGRAALAGIVLLCAGCARVPGIPTEAADVVRPDKQLDIHLLYKQNCSGCHGENGRGGAAIPLNNPAYLAFAGADNLRTATAKGITGTMMPAFAASSGGMLTEQQVDAIVHGMIHEWSRPTDFTRVTLPPYADPAPGNPTDGQKAYVAACARCHGADGLGIKTSSPTAAGEQAAVPHSIPHSIVDRSYLALVNDQSLRSYVIAGHLDDNAPDWRAYIAGHPLAPQEITDIVAWLAQHRQPVASPSETAPEAKHGVATKERQ
jgi:cytochrome c oxidase cbb3-type subunit 3/ubiquinol-cytochrome c reductase cytochrome c subunit